MMPEDCCVGTQVRQHTEHKRTFMYLEQLILKHNADAHCVSIKEIHEVRRILPSLIAVLQGGR